MSDRPERADRLGARLDHLPTAMAAARAAFEAGLRLAWIHASQVQQERAIRVLLIHSSQAGWKRKVASDYDLTSAGGDRWRQAAKVQEDLVSHALGKIGSPELPKRIPSVAEQLREMGRRIAGLRPVQVGSSAAARLSDSHRLKSAVFQLR